jgi:plasmid stabilization system protein ParE
MKVRILRSAFDDLTTGRNFYDRQHPGVGDYFFDSLFSEIDSLMFFGGIHRMQFGYHRLLARRFPYAVYYRILAGEAVVFRVLDCRRDPKRIQKTLKQDDKDIKSKIL